MVDGALLTTPEPYEPDAVAACREWFAQTGRPVYGVGPVLPSASKATVTAGEKKQSNDATKVQAFLDNVLETDGPQSVLYVSMHGPHKILMKYSELTVLCICRFRSALSFGL